MRINNNLMAMNTNRQLGINNTGTAKSLEKLSSGFRINRAGDDAAGLAISEKMRGQIRGLNMASKNAQDGISLIQSAEGSLTETHAILQRMRELAVQSSSDTNVTIDRGEIQKEVDQLAEEITRIAENTEFNTQKLLDGSFKDKTFHIGANEGQNVKLSIEKMDAEALKVAGVEGASFEVTGTAGTATLDKGTYEVVKLDEEIKITNNDTANNGEIKANYALLDKDGKVAAVSADGKGYIKLDNAVELENIGTGGVTNNTAALTFEDAVTHGEVVVDNNGGAKANATVTTKLASGSYKVVDENDSVFVASGKLGLINSDGELVAISDDGKEWKAVNDKSGDSVLKTVTILAKGAEITVSGKGIDVSTQETADKAITVIQSAIETVSAERSKLGAMQNRLEHTIKNLDNTSENLQAAESRIRDVDMAKEMMEFTKQNILQQAATAMLAQANQAPQTVLQLLR